MSRLLERLNAVQRDAVLHREGPLVIFAGAGSGKTRIITTRIAYLIEQKVLPWEILAVTFTNKAAEEMRTRVELLSPDAKRAVVTTFHSASARWLREFASELGFDAHFTIYDDQDSQKALKHVLKELNPKADIPTLASEMKHFIHTMKTAGILPHEADQFAIDHPQLVPTGGVTVYRAYQEYLAKCNAMDFGDLLMNLLLLLRNNARVREILCNRFRYIMVDEFQDTNRTQFEIVHILSSSHKNLVVVGDDDQSIYSWRGANPSNIIDFQRTFPEARRIALEQNYRCTANIVNAASKLVSNNRTRAPKTLFTEASAGDPIHIHIEADAEMEAYWVAEQISLERKKLPYEEIAIFYRTNSQSRSLEEALRYQKIPYTVFGSLEFYERLEVKDMIAYLRLIVNENDQVSFNRIINVPSRGLGDKALEQIQSLAKDQSCSLMQAARQLSTPGQGKAAPKLKYFCDLMSALKADLRNAPLGEIINTLLEATDYPEYLKKKFPEQFNDKMDNIQELATAMLEAQRKNQELTLEEWLQTISLVREEDDGNGPKGVALMTLHMAKGLEFRRVFITGVEDGLLPHRNSSDDPMSLEEERRLLYVGMTRAKEKLSLSCARRRRSYNNEMVNPPSRFLKEIPRDCLELSLKAAELFEPKSVEVSQTSYHFEDEESELSQGSHVVHPTYGAGIIEGFEESFGQAKVLVKFRDFGFRKIRPSQLQVIRNP